MAEAAAAELAPAEAALLSSSNQSQLTCPSFLIQPRRGSSADLIRLSAISRLIMYDDVPPRNSSRVVLSG